MQRHLTLALPLLFALQLQAQSPTWSDDVACIAFTHCASCHHDGGLAPFSLTNYPDAYWWREEMRVATQVRMMPPWPPDPNYRSLAHERVLTQAEIDIIAAWVDGGAPEGLPQNAPPPPVYTNEAVIDNPDITAIMEEYTIPVSSEDLYRCFVMPINNPTDRYITGLEVIPGNTAMVHHVLLYQDTTGQAQGLDAADADPGYTSFGGIGVDEAKLVGVWVPGSQPYFTPVGMGMKLFAGADLVMQIHYPTNDVLEVDSTRVNIQLAPPGFLRDLSLDAILDHVVTISDGPLVIAPNVVDTFHAEYTLPIPATITAIGPHSHLLGDLMKAWAVKPDGEVVPLIDIPHWDFHWQGLYSFRRPIFLPTGTTLYCESTYDNTVNNPDNPNDPPDWVWLGEATTNEMMLYFFAWTYGFASDENIVVDDAPHMAHYLNCTPDFNIGMEESVLRESWSVYPSPATDRIVVSTALPGAELRLIDVSGRVVFKERIRSTMQEIGVSALARGLYTVELAPRDAPTQRIKVLLE